MDRKKKEDPATPGPSKNDEDDKKPPDPPDDSLMLRPGHGAMSLSPGQISPLSEQEQIDNYTARYPIPGMPHEKRDMVLPLRPLSERPSRVRNLMSFMDLTATNAELDKLTVEELAKRPTPSKLITARIEKNPRFFQSCMPTRPDEMKQRLECHEMPETDDDPDRRSPPPIDAVPTKSCIRNEERKPAEERSVQFNYVKVTRYYIDNYDPIFKVARKWRRERGRDITFADSMAPSMRHLYLQVADYHTDLIYPTVIDRIDTSDRGMVASGFGMHYTSPPNTRGSPRRCGLAHIMRATQNSELPHTSELEQSSKLSSAESPETSGSLQDSEIQPEIETKKTTALAQKGGLSNVPSGADRVQVDDHGKNLESEDSESVRDGPNRGDIILVNENRNDEAKNNYQSDYTTIDDTNVANENAKETINQDTTKPYYDTAEKGQQEQSQDQTLKDTEKISLTDGAGYANGAGYDNDEYVDAPAHKNDDTDAPADDDDDNDDDDYTDAVAPQDDGCQDSDQQDNQDDCSVPEAGRLSRRRRLVRSLRSGALRIGRLFTSCCTRRRT